MNVAPASRRASAWRLGSALALAAIAVPVLAGCGRSDAGSGTARGSSRRSTRSSTSPSAWRGATPTWWA